jgi:hypothetical protein
MKRSEGRRRKRADRLLLKQRLRRERPDPFAGPAAKRTHAEKGDRRAVDPASHFSGGLPVDPDDTAPESPRPLRPLG